MKRVGIIGPGRLGMGLGLALQAAGYAVRLHGRREKPLSPGLSATWGEGTPMWVPAVDVILLSVPDDRVSAVACELAASGQVTGRHTALHLSGILGLSELEPLRACGCALGSLHPMQTLSEPTTAAERLHGATAAVDGDARARSVAETLASTLGMRCIRIPPEARPLYHAAAVFASNYVVVLAGVAQRLLENAGTSSEVAWEALRHLVLGTARNLASGDAVSALTGPIARGDTETLRKHLAVLSPGDADLYRALARAALSVAALTPAEKLAVEEQLHSA